MLTLTENATTIIKRLAKGVDDSARAGLRIYAVTGSSSGIDTAYSIDLAPAPEPGDRVVEVDGARVFMDASAGPRLLNKELDALVDSEKVTFSLRNQP